MTNKVLDEYIRVRKKEVDGWLARCDGEIFALLLESQLENGINGAVVEIGVHHGKSFIPMAISNNGRLCYAIDIFENQAFNIDVSGRGDKDVFTRNLTKFGVDANDVFIDERPSTDVTPDDIKRKVGRVRFFHIDGGHHFEAALNDLRLAEAVVSDDGVIAIDDVFRPEWPEVSMALFSYLANKTQDFVPFAIGYNKTYLCRRSFATLYRGILTGSDFLQLYFSKKYEVSNEAILVYQTYALPEWGVRAKISHYMKIYHPDLAFSLKKFLGRVGNRGHVKVDATDQESVRKLE
ncbi:class I SAM-dependent methyltransferase [Paraburkholderia sp. UYCP14C]|uniref:class I SAM-dependent methyltransferase n=1 Tax=Paraburkholderia sp. UYCP14C TaxID=2511130 RepID=UPI00101F3256|nr:class I SAM-dependent methyltransferase [Paraburkholderia sp. UYCP14C]RZF24726.1 class I SAM-dependent methyltransferase [Paraburkholderia sp. UYCP14C]